MKKNRLTIKKHIKKKIDYNTKLIRVELPNKNNSVISNENKSKVELRREIRTGIVLNENTTHKLFDVIIFISSYNRYNKLSRLLNQIYTQETKYKFKLIFMDDGSTDLKYNTIKTKYPDIVYLRNETNFGKKGYWKTINRIFSEIQRYGCDVIIQIDDDFIIKDNFIDKLYEEYKNHKKNDIDVVALYYHRFVGDLENRWGLKSNWLDGGALFEYDFMIKIGFKITPIRESRWSKNKNLSSGVWHQLSKKINLHDKKIHKTKISYVIHDGNDISIMNNTLRKTHKIISHE